MKDREIYARAAEIVITSDHFFPSADVCVCMCDALFRACRQSDKTYLRLSRKLKEHFEIDAVAAGNDSYRWGRNFGTTPEEIRECRALALCFMAAMSAS